MACIVCVNKLDTKLLTKMSLTVFIKFEVAQNKQYTMANSDV